MGELKQLIDRYNAQKQEKVPQEVLEIMAHCTGELQSQGIEQRALGEGELMPSFSLQNQHGEMRSLDDYLQQGILVLNIYRGGWCPYCNMEMKALHDVLPQIREHGAQLVGLSPELPEKAQLTGDQNSLDIDILFDQGNEYSEQLGLVFELPEALRPIYQKSGIDIPKSNGDVSFRLPVPATYIVGSDGRVIMAFVNSDYTQRLEPVEILTYLTRQ